MTTLNTDSSDMLFTAETEIDFPLDTVERSRDACCNLGCENLDVGAHLLGTCASSDTVSTEPVYEIENSQNCLKKTVSVTDYAYSNGVEACSAITTQVLTSARNEVDRDDCCDIAIAEENEDLRHELVLRFCTNVDFFINDDGELDYMQFED